MSIEETGSAPIEGLFTNSPQIHKLPLFSSILLPSQNELFSPFPFLDTLSGKSGLDTDKQAVKKIYQEWRLDGECVQPFHTTFICDKCGKIHDMVFGCGSRIDSVCPACAQKWRDDTAKAYSIAMQGMRTPKLITLTLKKNGGFDAKEKDLWSLFHQLRRILKEIYHLKIRSWFGIIEFPNHIHVIADCGYIHQWKIQKIWRQLTFGESWFVNIKKINIERSPRKITNYVTKYVSKTKGLSCLDPRDLKGFRLKQSWKILKFPPLGSICHSGFIRKASDWEIRYQGVCSCDNSPPSSPGPP